MAAIQVDRLVVRFGARSAVDGISFSVDKGEVVALLGPNGAGKTTTVETLEGYRVPSEGRVRVLGLDPRSDHPGVVGRIGVVLQRGGVYPVMSPARVLRLFASYYPHPRSPEELLSLLGLEEVADTPFKRLSGGEQQRVLLALALVGRPEVCFLDEPTAGVDPAGRVVVRDVIARCRDEGTAVLLTSHELDEVERMADRVVIIHRGMVRAAGTSSELGGEVEIRFSANGPVPLEALEQELGASIARDGSGYRVVAGASDGALVARLTALLAEKGIELTDLRVGRERLEEVFLRLVAEEEGR